MTFFTALSIPSPLSPRVVSLFKELGPLRNPGIISFDFLVFYTILISGVLVGAKPIHNPLIADPQPHCCTSSHLPLPS